MASPYKIRIQLLDSNGHITSDRLVSQYEELLNGPKESHKGPVRIEFVLDSKETKERLLEYLAKLESKVIIPKASAKKSTSAKEINPYDQIIKMVDVALNMEDAIAKLEEINFRWVTQQFLEELPKDKQPFDVSKLKNEWQWLVRFERQAKDPQNDKFDFNLMFGIKFIGDVKDKILVKQKDKKSYIIDKEWKKRSSANMKRKKIPLIFPSYMTIEERKDWRYLRRKVELNRELSKKERAFYERCLPDVQNLDMGYDNKA